jgi:hypothetical protein|tara:strand:+ start:544 stop:696 length:153 start_codon:yes stop_codon:yes gene_type:complete
MVEAIILKLCFGFDELEKLKQQPEFSSYVIYAEMEEENLEECFYVRVEKW